MSGITAATIVFADIVGSTGLYLEVGEARAYDRITGLLDSLARTSTAYRGHVVKRLGDAVMCDFAHAADALTASAAMHAVAGRDGLKLRIGMQSGDVTRDPNGDVYGDAVNVSARLHDIAVAGETLVGEALVSRLDASDRNRLRHIDDRILDGRSLPTAIYQCLAGDGDGVTSLAQRPVDREGTAPAWHVHGAGCVLAIPRQPAGLTIGRSRDCDLTIAAGFASRVHATLSIRANGIAIEDTSTNGTYLRTDSGQERLLHRDRTEVAAPTALSLGQYFDAADPALYLYLVRGEKP